MTKKDIELRLQLAGFTPIPPPGSGMIACVHPIREISLLVSIRKELDGKEWVHISIASPVRSPTWDDLILARDATVGRDKKAIQVLPPAKEHVDFHPLCFHLFHCIDEDPLPDFTKGTGTL